MNEQVPEVIPPQGPKRLVRSREKRMFLGVCGGLGEYFDIDATVVRLLFVVGVFLGGTSIAVYAVLALIMPAEEAAEIEPRAAAQVTLNEALDEVQTSVNRVVTWGKGLFNRSGGSSASTTSDTTYSGASTTYTPPPSAPTTTGTVTGTGTVSDAGSGPESGTDTDTGRSTGTPPTGSGGAA